MGYPPHSVGLREELEHVTKRSDPFLGAGRAGHTTHPYELPCSDAWLLTDWSVES
jgi:hypothetical protein